MGRKVYLLATPDGASRRESRGRPTVSKRVLLGCSASAVIWLFGCGKATVDGGQAGSGGLGREQTHRAERAARVFFSAFFNEVQAGSLSAEGRQKLSSVTTPAVLEDLVRASQSVGNQAAPCLTKEFHLTPRAQGRVLAETVMLCDGLEVGYGVEFVEQRDIWVVKDLRDGRYDRRGRCRAVTCQLPSPTNATQPFGPVAQDETVAGGG